MNRGSSVEIVVRRGSLCFLSPAFTTDFRVLSRCLYFFVRPLCCCRCYILRCVACSFLSLVFLGIQVSIFGLRNKRISSVRVDHSSARLESLEPSPQVARDNDRANGAELICMRPRPSGTIRAVAPGAHWHCRIVRVRSSAILQHALRQRSRLRACTTRYLTFDPLSYLLSHEHNPQLIPVRNRQHAATGNSALDHLPCRFCAIAPQHPLHTHHQEHPAGPLPKVQLRRLWLLPRRWHMFGSTTGLQH